MVSTRTTFCTSWILSTTNFHAYAVARKCHSILLFLTGYDYEQYRNQITAFYREDALVERYLPHYRGIDSKVTARQTHLEVFGEAQFVAILFDYEHKDLLQNAQYTIIPLEELAQAEANLRMEK